MPQVPTSNWQREKCYKATRWFHKIKLVCPLPCHTAKSAIPTASRRRLLALFFVHGSCLECLHYVRPNCWCQRNDAFSVKQKCDQCTFLLSERGIMKYMVRVPRGRCNLVCTPDSPRCELFPQEQRTWFICTAIFVWPNCTLFSHSHQWHL